MVKHNTWHCTNGGVKFPTVEQKPPKWCLRELPAKTLTRITSLVWIWLCFTHTFFILPAIKMDKSSTYISGSCYSKTRSTAHSPSASSPLKVFQTKPQKLNSELLNDRTSCAPSVKYLQGFLNKLIMPTISDEVRETSDLIFSEEETEAMKSPKRRTCLAIFVAILKRTLKDIL